MLRANMGRLAGVVCLLAVACPDATPQACAGGTKSLDGLWSGSWGGGERNGVVFQPVLADMYVKGDHVELAGFRNVSRLTGKVRFDSGTGRVQITPSAAAIGQPAPKPLDYEYELKGDSLTLIDADKVATYLRRLPTVQNPFASAQVELVAASGITEAGDLLVTGFTVLQAGRAAITYFQPAPRSLSTRQAVVLLVQETGLKTVTVAEARRLLRESVPVAVTYRQDNRPVPPQAQARELWKDVGAPQPDSEAVAQTFARLLRPGTLVFILSARENVPRP